MSAPNAGSKSDPDDVVLHDGAVMVSVFFSYAHADEALRDDLEKQLALLKRQGTITTWHDRCLVAGEEIDRVIDRQVDAAEIILLLVSADFLASDYCYDRELAKAIERHNADKAVVIPVILRACDWHDAPFGKLMAAPADGKPITQWADRDQAMLEVARAVKAAARQLISKGSAGSARRVAQSEENQQCSNALPQRTPECDAEIDYSTKSPPPTDLATLLPSAVPVAVPRSYDPLPTGTPATPRTPPLPPPPKTTPSGRAPFPKCDLAETVVLLEGSAKSNRGQIIRFYDVDGTDGYISVPADARNSAILTTKRGTRVLFVEFRLWDDTHRFTRVTSMIHTHVAFAVPHKYAKTGASIQMPTTDNHIRADIEPFSLPLSTGWGALTGTRGAVVGSIIVGITQVNFWVFKQDLG